jgi:hypothetical protein
MPNNSTTKLRQFDLVRFANQKDGGPVHRLVSVMRDDMVELHDLGGYFAPHLFKIADDIGDMPLDGAPPSRLNDVGLLPCPFCGGDAEFGAVGGDGGDAGGQFVQCTNAMCGASSALIFPCGDEPKPLLIEKWNRRATNER